MAVISQSGAFMISRMSKMPRIEPLYAVSLGNQIDLTVSDYLEVPQGASPRSGPSPFTWRASGPATGYAFARAVKEITAAGRTVIVYKVGALARKDAGRPRAIRPRWPAIIRSAGPSWSRPGPSSAGTSRSSRTWSGDSSAWRTSRPRGNRVGLLSNAGFECVVMADSLKGDGGGLELAAFSAETGARIAAALGPLGIDKLQDVHNPLDVTPVADDAAFSGCAEAVIDDPSVDCAVISPVPMTPAMQTLAPSAEGRAGILDPGSFAQRIIALFRRTDKPFVVNVDAGKVYDPLCDLLDEAGIPVFRRSDEALRFLRRYVAARRNDRS